MAPDLSLVVVEMCDSGVVADHGNDFDDLDAIIPEDLLLLRIVRHHSATSDSEVEEDGNGMGEIADVAAHGIHLAVVGFQFLVVAMPLALVREVVQHHAGTVLLFENPKGFFELPVAVTALVVKDVAGRACRVDADEGHCILRQVRDIALVEQRMFFDATTLHSDVGALKNGLELAVKQRDTEVFVRDRRQLFWVAGGSSCRFMGVDRTLGSVVGGLPVFLSTGATAGFAFRCVVVIVALGAHGCTP